MLKDLFGLRATIGEALNRWSESRERDERAMLVRVHDNVVRCAGELLRSEDPDILGRWSLPLLRVASVIDTVCDADAGCPHNRDVTSDIVRAIGDRDYRDVEAVEIMRDLSKLPLLGGDPRAANQPRTPGFD